MAPWQITEAMEDPARRGWVYRGLEFVQMEASVRTGSGSGRA